MSSEAQKPATLRIVLLTLAAAAGVVLLGVLIWLAFRASPVSASAAPGQAVTANAEITEGKAVYTLTLDTTAVQSGVGVVLTADGRNYAVNLVNSGSPSAAEPAAAPKAARRSPAPAEAPDSRPATREERAERNAEPAVEEPAQAAPAPRQAAPAKPQSSAKSSRSASTSQPADIAADKVRSSPY